MAGREHRYVATVVWTGNQGSGTSSYKAYGRDHLIRIAGKPDILGSSDPAFRGDPARHNPEDMLVASLSSCHMLWYLSLAAKAGLIVTAYEDAAEGSMAEDADGGGRFTGVTLRPVVTLSGEDAEERGLALHHEAHRLCFVANSVNFPVHCEPKIIVSAEPDRYSA